MEVLDVVKEHGGIPVGIGLLVDRSGGKLILVFVLKLY